MTDFGNESMTLCLLFAVAALQLRIATRTVPDMRTMACATETFQPLRGVRSVNVDVYTLSEGNVCVIAEAVLPSGQHTTVAAREASVEEACHVASTHIANWVGV